MDFSYTEGVVTKTPEESHDETLQAYYDRIARTIDQICRIDMLLLVVLLVAKTASRKSGGMKIIKMQYIWS